MSRRDVAADINQAVAAMVQAELHIDDAVRAAQRLDIGALALARLRSNRALMRQRAEQLRDIARNLDRAEIIPDGIQSAGMCGECGRIGDHQPRCPEVPR